MRESVLNYYVRAIVVILFLCVTVSCNTSQTKLNGQSRAKDYPYPHPGDGVENTNSTPRPDCAYKHDDYSDANLCGVLEKAKNVGDYQKIEVLCCSQRLKSLIESCLEDYGTEVTSCG